MFQWSVGRIGHPRGVSDTQRLVCMCRACQQEGRVCTCVYASSSRPHVRAGSAAAPALVSAE
eukprot:1126849-Prorocentrum_minimum.AAC.2